MLDGVIKIWPLAKIVGEGKTGAVTQRTAKDQVCSVSPSRFASFACVRTNLTDEVMPAGAVLFRNLVWLMMSLDSFATMVD